MGFLLQKTFFFVEFKTTTVKKLERGLSELKKNLQDLVRLVAQNNRENKKDKTCSLNDSGATFEDKKFLCAADHFCSLPAHGMCQLTLSY